MAKKDKEIQNEREERIKKICGVINKSTFGGENGNAVTWLGSRDTIIMKRFPSGDPQLDDALGGGWPKGRFIEVFGPEAGGKTTLTLHALAEHQKMFPNEDCALIDTEFAFDESYAQAIGVDTRYLIVHQPDSGEQALNILKMLIQSGIGVIIVDSVAALTTKAELEGDIGDTHVGQQARLMSQALRQLVMEAGSRGTTVFWTNQMRDKIGVMYGDKTTTPAGHALKHYASIRAHICAIGKVKEKVKGEDLIVSTQNLVNVKKNKTAPPFRRAKFCVSFGHGIDKIAGLLDAALALKLIVKKGGWFSMGDKQIGQGRLQIMEMIRKDVDMFDKLNEDITAAKAAGVVESLPEDVEEQAPSGDDPDSADAVGVVEEGAEAQDA
jgi:recombination protein RecA